MQNKLSGMFGGEEMQIWLCVPVKSSLPFALEISAHFADSSWVDVKSSRKSTNCHYTLWNNALVHWSCVQDVSFCRKLTDELGFKQTKPTILWEDNNGLFELSSQVRPLYKDRSKHFEIRFRFISDYVDRGLLERRHVDSKDQLTDLGTVPRPWPQLHRMRPTLYDEV